MNNSSEVDELIEAAGPREYTTTCSKCGGVATSSKPWPGPTPYRCGSCSQDGDKAERKALKKHRRDRSAPHPARGVRSEDSGRNGQGDSRLEDVDERPGRGDREGDQGGEVMADAATAPARPRTRPRTISMRRFSKAELDRGRSLYPEVDYWKPKTRSDCVDGDRPCLFVSCKWHLYLDVDPVRGSIKLNFPYLEPDELAETCALDVVDHGGATLERVGDLMNLTKERVRQIQRIAIRRVQAAMALEAW